jgi:hypothetical protein
VSFGTAGAFNSEAVAEAAMVFVVVLGRFASGELGREGGACPEVSVLGGGVAVLVIMGGSFGLCYSQVTKLCAYQLLRNALSGPLRRVRPDLDRLHWLGIPGLFNRGSEAGMRLLEIRRRKLAVKSVPKAVSFAPS